MARVGRSAVTASALFVLGIGLAGSAGADPARTTPSREGGGRVGVAQVLATDCQTGAVTFTFTDAEQCYTVSADVSELQIVAVGGRGGDSIVPGIQGGQGAVASGRLHVSPGHTLFVDVGANGNSHGVAVFGGGGGGPDILSPSGAASGGGASDVRTVPSAEADSLASRLLVAGGGGGAGFSTIGNPDPSFPPNAGGSAGTDPNGNGSNGEVGGYGSVVEDGGGGGGATLSTGGVGGLGGSGTIVPGPSGQPGVFGVGGIGGVRLFRDIVPGGSGGGGYFGGGGGGAGGQSEAVFGSSGGGGAGSSFTAPAIANARITTGTTDTPKVQITPLPTNKQQCKHDGWKSFGIFNDEGQCVMFVGKGT